MNSENKLKPIVWGSGRFVAAIITLVALMIFGFLLNISVGSVHISVGEVFNALRSAVCNDAVNTTESRIILNIRLPRLLLAAILGGALSVSGFLLQTFFRNPIAGPFVLGISSGAKMMVGITLIFASRYIGYISSGMLIVSAFIGALIITFAILLLSGRIKNMSMLLVIGIMVGYICGAVTDFFIAFANEHDIVNLTSWSMGTFSGASWSNVKTAFVICLPVFFASWFLSKPMEAYSLGEGYAMSMGVNIKLVRVILILLSSLLSACVTALAGPISFVGIAVPHITRTLLKSSKPSHVIPASFICGAVFCIFCDLIARTVFAPTELAIGTVTSVFGAPVVVYIMVKRRKNRED